MIGTVMAALSVATRSQSGGGSDRSSACRYQANGSADQSCLPAHCALMTAEACQCDRMRVAHSLGSKSRSRRADRAMTVCCWVLSLRGTRVLLVRREEGCCGARVEARSKAVVSRARPFTCGVGRRPIDWAPTRGPPVLPARPVCIECRPTPWSSPELEGASVSCSDSRSVAHIAQAE